MATPVERLRQAAQSMTGMTENHPCPTPKHPRKGAQDGDLWACTCGKVYVRRHWSNYAGDGFEWSPTLLVAEVKA